ncbi:hypothetical protein P3S68_016790 [Capsicum galapagoense]
MYGFLQIRSRVTKFSMLGGHLRCFLEGSQAVEPICWFGSWVAGQIQVGWVGLCGSTVAGGSGCVLVVGLLVGVRWLFVR